jgi:hypothetical protein
METQQAAINTYLITPDDSTGNSVLGNVLTSKLQQPGTYLVLTKRYMEMGSLFFTLYK